LPAWLETLNLASGGLRQVIPEFVKWGIAREARYASTHHGITTHTCEIDGDTAHTESYVHWFLRLKASDKVRAGGGRYVDRLERRNGAWKITLRRLLMEGARINRIFLGPTGRGLSANVRSAALEARARENKPDRKIEVPSDVRPTLPAAVRLEAALRRCKPDQEGFVSARGPTLLRVRRVRPEDVGRVVRLVQAILAAAIARGLALKAGDEDLTLVVEGTAIVLGLRGWSKRKRTRVYSGPDPLNRSRPRWRYEYEPTGRLSLQIDDGHVGHRRLPRRPLSQEHAPRAGSMSASVSETKSFAYLPECAPRTVARAGSAFYCVVSCRGSVAS